MKKKQAFLGLNIKSGHFVTVRDNYRSEVILTNLGGILHGDTHAGNHKTAMDYIVWRIDIAWWEIPLPKRQVDMDEVWQTLEEHLPWTYPWKEEVMEKLVIKYLLYLKIIPIKLDIAWKELWSPYMTFNDKWLTLWTAWNLVRVLHSRQTQENQIGALRELMLRELTLLKEASHA